jgi:peptidoglycan/xylan/chitin deacetylase (PgdA/CDA1 family)
MILYYHNIIDVAPDGFDRRAERVYVERFRGQMEQIAHHYHPVTLNRYLDNLKAECPEPKFVAVTFDDGYRGVLEHAAPILHKVGIPAAVFVVTNYANNTLQTFHFDQVEIAFRLTAKRQLCMNLVNEPHFDLGSLSARIECMTWIKRLLRTMSEESRRLYQRVLLGMLEVSEERCNEYAQTERKYAVLGWNDIREMAKLGWTVGSHTQSHATVGYLKSGDLNRELRSSLEDIRRELNVSDVPFAYPFGGKEHIGRFGPKAVQRAGYSCAVTTIRGVNDSEPNLYLLQRISTSAG